MIEGGWRPLAGPLAGHVRGAGPRVAFLHGFTQTGWSWRRVADRIAELRHEVCLVDLPGHGGSGSIRADLRTTADLVAATVGTATYVGYSFGGRVLLHLALSAPHHVERMALVGASPGIVDEAERARRRAADDALAARILEIGTEAFLAEWLALPMFAGLQPSDADLDERRVNTPEGLASSLRLCGVGNQLPLWGRLAELNMPVLALAGEHDEKFLPLAQRIAGSVPDGRFAEVHGAGHAAHLEQPTQLAARLEFWLRDTGRAAGRPRRA